MEVQHSALHASLAPKIPRVSGHVLRRPSRRSGDPDRWMAKWRDHEGQHQHRLGLLRDDAGVRPLTFHDLRHTFASLLARAGEPVTVIQAEAGHADLRTTERYMHHRPRRQDAARFGRAFAIDAVEQLEVAA
jgi:integrase